MISCRRDVYNEIVKVVRASKVQWRGRSYAASVQSEIADNTRGRRKVSKHERKAMLESFVDRYRSQNAGNFPTASEARKQVGGSYYVIRQLLQELQHRSKISQANETSIGKEPRRESERFSGNAVSHDVRTESQDVAIHMVEVQDTNAEPLEGRRGSKVSTFIEETLSKNIMIAPLADDQTDFVVTHNHLVKELAEENSHLSVENTEDAAKEEAVNLVKGPENVSKEEAANQVEAQPKEVLHRPENASNQFHQSIEKVNQIAEEEVATEDVLDVDVVKQETEQNQVLPDQTDFVVTHNHLAKVLAEDNSHTSFEKTKDAAQGEATNLAKGLEDDSKAEASNQVKAQPKEVLCGPENVSEDEAATQVHQSIEKVDHIAKEKVATEDVLHVDVLKQESEQNQVLLDSKRDARKNSEKQIEQLPKKTSFWGNLKLLADGIFGMWKKH